jgi:(S)-ureidoglycine aminohydrolase
LKHLGATRSRLCSDHLLQTPDTFIRAPLPGMEGATAIVHCGSALGAKFTEYTAEMQPGGTLDQTNLQRFLYVLEGNVALEVEGKEQALSQSSYAYLPPEFVYVVRAMEDVRLLVIEKDWQRHESFSPPSLLIGHESQIEPEALGGDPDLQVRALLPADTTFDFAVNTMTFQPGASLALVEVHVMEHGLLMLEGGGIYRLSDDWYPVSAGDFIWMAPYCPQWFGALGKRPAKYILYKDWNRHPLRTL